MSALCDPVFYSLLAYLVSAANSSVITGGSEIPLQYNPTHCHCLSLRLMKIMVMNVFGAL